MMNDPAKCKLIYKCDFDRIKVEKTEGNNRVLFEALETALDSGSAVRSPMSASSINSATLFLLEEEEMVAADFCLTYIKGIMNVGVDIASRYSW